MNNNLTPEQKIAKLKNWKPNSEFKKEMKKELKNQTKIKKMESNSIEIKNVLEKKIIDTVKFSDNTQTELDIENISKNFKVSKTFLRKEIKRVKDLLLISNRSINGKKGKKGKKVYKGNKKLQDTKHLLDLILSEFKKEIVGEQDTIKCLVLTITGKFIINKSVTSFHTLINSKSGSGKDFILKKFIPLFENEEIEHYSRISSRALDYLHTSRKDVEECFTWDNKFLFLHDVENDILNCSTLKVFLTEGSNTAIVQDGIMRTRSVNGIPTVLFSSAFSDPNNEMLRRVNIINLDESKEQTKKIMKFQAKDSIEKINYKEIKELFSILECHNVKIPFSDKLADSIPDEDVFIRTFFKKILDYIKSSCVLNQIDREKDSNGFLIAIEEDYNNAKFVIERLSTGTNFKPLSLAKKQVLESLKEKFNNNWFSLKEAESVTGIGYSTIRSHLQVLYNEKYLYQRLDRETNVFKPIIQYSICEKQKVELPEFREVNILNTLIHNNTLNTINTINTIESTTEKNKIEFVRLLKVVEELNIESAIRQGFSNDLIQSMIKKGEIFEYKSGKVKLLK